jgi:hypothetical protein
MNSPVNPLTFHARARMQQRGVSADALDLLLSYGKEAHDHHGAVILFMDKAAQKRLEAASRAKSEVRRLAGLYAVLSRHGQVITVGHRTRRINRA